VSGGVLAAIVAAAGAAALLVAEDRRARAAGFAAWAAGGLVLVGSVASTPIANMRVSLTAHPLTGAVLVLAGLAALAAGAWVFARWPAAFAVAAVLAAPARFPVTVGGQEARLLVPLYVIVAMGAAAAAWELARGTERTPRLGPVGPALATFVVLSAVSLAWSADEQNGKITMLFFYLPFTFVLARVAALPRPLSVVRPALVAQCALAVLFGAVALWQEATRHIFWNPAIIVSNEYVDYFRVNSLFWDASVYGRFMAVTIVLLAAVLVFRGRPAWIAALVAGLALAAYFSYSQSSMIALAAGIMVLAAAVWPRRLTLGIVAAAALVAAIVLATTVADTGTARATAGRSRLVDLGAKVVREHPLAGAGLGGFQRAARAGSRFPWKIKRAASHTTPVTVLAELGPAGLAAYVWLLAAVVVLALRGHGVLGMRMALLAAVTAIFASSLFYNAFFEDPATWILVGLLAALAARPARLEAPA
jgi:hypothetical protein